MLIIHVSLKELNRVTYEHQIIKVLSEFMYRFGHLALESFPLKI